MVTDIICHEYVVSKPQAVIRFLSQIKYEVFLGSVARIQVSVMQTDSSSSSSSSSALGPVR